MCLNLKQGKSILGIPFTRRGVKRRVVVLDHPIGNLERCHSCNADCCRSFPAVNITWHEYNTLKSLGARRLFFTLSGRCKLIIEDGCEFLINDRCSIYADRPDICKRFMCADTVPEHKKHRLTLWWIHPRKPKPLPV